MRDLTGLVNQKDPLARSPCRLEGLLPTRASDLCYTGGRTFENCVKFTGEYFKDIVGMWKTYGMFRAKSEDKERERLRWIRDEQAWENGGRKV